VNYFTPPTETVRPSQPRRLAVTGAARPNKPPRPPSRGGGKRTPQVARPSDGNILRFVSELRPSRQCSSQGSPLPWSQDETANQADLYAHYTQGYSQPSHAALLEQYRHYMGDYLMAMLERRCSHHMLNYANADVTVPLNSLFGEIGFRKVPCLSALGVTWGDVLHFLGYTLAHWTNLTLAVINYCRPTLHALPLSARTDAITYEEFLTDFATRNSSLTTKRLRARTAWDPPVVDGNYCEVLPSQVATVDDSALGGSPRESVPLRLTPPSSPPVRPPSSVCPSLRALDGSGSGLLQRPVTPLPSASCYFQVVEPLGLHDVVPRFGDVADSRPERTSLLDLSSSAAVPGDRPRPAPLSSAAGDVAAGSNALALFPLSAAPASSGRRPLRKLVGDAVTSRHSAFERPVKSRSAPSSLITSFYRVVEPSGRAPAPAPPDETVCATLSLDQKTPEDPLKTPSPGLGTSSRT
jgi:hypothetical protein